jgi:hypothetical protein
MTEISRRRTDITPQRRIGAASCQFAHLCYSMARLAGLLAEAELINWAKYLRVPWRL